MIVEGQGMGFWTRVRLPSGPLMGMPENVMFWAFSNILKVKKSRFKPFETILNHNNWGQNWGQEKIEKAMIDKVFKV